MQTSFSPDQLRDPAMRSSEKILRTCVHCGFCTATCPTYLLLGDELDSPRGRIYLVKDMLERRVPASAEVVTHIDRCLSCLSCMTTCPSGVNYMHLVDHARAYIEATYRRPWPERLLRAALATILPHPARVHAALRLAALAKPLRGVVAALPAVGPRLAAMLDLAPAARRGSPAPDAPPRTETASRRVALLAGCVQPVLRPEIDAAAVRFLRRHEIATVVPAGSGCCGALAHHLGREAESRAFARRNIDAWWPQIADGLDAIVATASGCGTMIKDYGFLLRDDPAYAAKAARVSALARDVAEYAAALAPLPSAPPRPLVVAYHSACSMQHGQQIHAAPKALLARAGFVVKDVPEGHICCGSAGSYNLLQPELAGRLAARKLANIARTSPDVIATGNIGCMTHLARGAGVPIVHTVELLDWAAGGPAPPGLEAARR